MVVETPRVGERLTHKGPARRARPHSPPSTPSSDPHEPSLGRSVLDSSSLLRNMGVGGGGRTCSLCRRSTVCSSGFSEVTSPHDPGQSRHGPSRPTPRRTSSTVHSTSRSGPGISGESLGRRPSHTGPGFESVWTSRGVVDPPCSLLTQGRKVVGTLVGVGERKGSSIRFSSPRH